MYRYRKEGDPLFVKDPWAPYRYVYHTPTEIEFDMIKPFLVKFAFEDDEFVEDECKFWVDAKKDLDCPDLRHILMNFVKQVRESKGYDVDMTVGFFGSPFMPLELDKKHIYDRGMAGTNIAITKINRLTSLQSDKKYEFVSLDKYVRTIARTMLLTITVLEVDSDAMEIDGVNADGCLKIIQAVVYQPQLTEFRLLEWKFKPDPPTCSFDCSCNSSESSARTKDYLRWIEMIDNTCKKQNCA